MQLKMQNRIDFDEIVNDTLEIFQEYLHRIDKNLLTHRLSDHNFNELAGRDFPLNWSYIIDDKLALDGGFDFGLTWKGQNQLIGAFISAYKPREKCLEIYAIERLEDGDLQGNMMRHSLYACFLLFSFIDGQSIKVIDVEADNHELRNFYKSFGFKEINEQDFILTRNDLNKLFGG